MRQAAIPGLDLLARTAGTGTSSRALECLRREAILDAWWDDEDGTFNGIVRGSAGQEYETTVYFTRTAAGRLKFGDAFCNCPVGIDCKHAVALALLGLVRGEPDDERPEPAGQASAEPQAWERSLDAMLPAAAGRPAPTGLGQALTPLAIELTLSRSARAGFSARPDAGDQEIRLLARLVRAGKNGGWVAGSLAWSRLDTLSYQRAETYSDDQVRLLQELYALYRAGDARSGYYYYYGETKVIELSAFESRRLWPLLDEARSAGLRLVHGKKLGDVDAWRQAEFCLDVTASAAGLELSPLLRADGAQAGQAPVAFIGTGGHGVVYADPADLGPAGDPVGCRFGIARLAEPVPPALQHLALAGEALAIPAAGQARFASAYYPRLRRTATIVSSDGSFSPPEISGPALALQVTYGGGHAADLAWEWRYQIGESQLCHPPGQPGGEADFRDEDAERALLAAIDAPLDRFGLIAPGRPGTGGGPALVPRVRLDGIETMRFTTELLPALAGLDDLTVEVTGDPADYREASDSLLIGVSAGEVSGDPDWFDLGITITVDGTAVPFADVFVALSRGEDFLLLDDGAYFALDKPELRALARLIDEARALQDAPPGELRISRFQAGLWEELAELGVVGHQAAAWREQVAGLLSIGSVEPTQPPAGLRASLRPYQLDGFGWLAFLWEHRLGGILADDMGLGKTLQSLALICHARRADPAAAPFLIVAPTSVVQNWCAEAERFAPGLRVAAVTDTTARRGVPLGELVAGADAVVTSYTLLRMDFAAYQELAWSCLVLDEAQFVKNHQSKVYQCARRLAAPVKVAITGTPMENNLMELWSLLSITAPGLFPSPVRFGDYYARPIERGGQADLLAQLRRRIKPLVKRRTKEQVAGDLPPKQEQVLEIELHPQHRKVYQTHLQRERQRVLGLIGDMNANRFAIFRSLTMLRQLALHAGLVDESYAGLPSSKIDMLLGQVRDVTAVGHRALVFSQFTGFLAKVREGLDAAGVPYCYLDGSTTDRAKVIRRFKDGVAPVFLISLKAGGFGLNLTEADYCFLLDPWWNPATEAQAVDRTHRIGQTKNVMVYRLISAGTIEEKVMALKARKAELFASVMDDGGMFGASIDAEDIRALFD